MAKILRIERCEDCPFYEFDSTSRAYGPPELEERIWQSSRVGEKAVCMKTYTTFKVEDADQGVLDNCPLDDAWPNPLP